MTAYAAASAEVPPMGEEDAVEEAVVVAAEFRHPMPLHSWMLCMRKWICRKNGSKDAHPAEAV